MCSCKYCVYLYSKILMNTTGTIGPIQTCINEKDVIVWADVRVRVM
jgi:hypothetical protein